MPSIPAYQFVVSVIFIIFACVYIYWMVQCCCIGASLDVSLLTGTGDPWATRDPHGHGSGRENELVTGTGFLTGLILVSRAQIWVGKTRWVCARCQSYACSLPLYLSSLSCSLLPECYCMCCYWIQWVYYGVLLVAKLHVLLYRCCAQFFSLRYLLLE